MLACGTVIYVFKHPLSISFGNKNVKWGYKFSLFEHIHHILVPLSSFAVDKFLVCQLIFDTHS